MDNYSRKTSNHKFDHYLPLVDTSRIQSQAELLCNRGFYSLKRRN